MTARQAAQRTRWVVTSPLGTSGVWSSLGPADGPTLLVVGGHHGDEPAGYAAAGILSQYAQAEVGRLIVIRAPTHRRARSSRATPTAVAKPT